MIVVGDLNQLKPVQDSYAFEQGDDNLEVLAGPHVWQAFRFFRLTQVTRQRDDVAFAEALNRLPYGETTAEDDALFRSREFTRLSSQGEFAATDALHVFAVSNDVNDFNKAYVNSIDTESTIVTSDDYCEGHSTQAERRKALDYLLTLKPQTQNLARTVELKLNVPYMVTVNVRTSDSLTNGAIGILRHIAFGYGGNPEHPVVRVYLECNEWAGGPV